MLLIILNEAPINEWTALSELNHLLTHIIHLSLIHLLHYLSPSFLMYLVCELYNGFNVKRLWVLLWVDVLLEDYIEGSLWVVIVEVVKEEVTVVADSPEDQVEREDRGLGETSVEDSLNYGVVIDHMGEPSEKPRERKSWDVS